VSRDLSGVAWFTPLLDELARSGTLAFLEQTALFRKSLLTLTGVIRDVWPDASIDKMLVASGSRQLIGESWLRPLAPPSRGSSGRTFERGSAAYHEHPCVDARTISA
jgi:hypothetical protein